MTRGFIDGEYQDGEIRGLHFLLGRRGYGKTTEMDRRLSLCGGGVIFFDTLSKHAGVLQGYKILSQPEELQAYLRPNRGRRFRVLYQPRQGNLDIHFRAVALIVLAFGWMIFGVDEIDKLCGARWGDRRMPTELYDLVNYGRHHRVSMIATARRPQTVARAFTDEAELSIFNVKPAVADYLKDDIGPEYVPQATKLEKYYYLQCSADEEPVLKGGPRTL